MSEINNNESGLVIIDCGTITSLPVTITDSRIKSNHIVIKMETPDKFGIAGNWFVSTSDGSLTITGAIVASAIRVKLYLAEAISSEV